MLRALGVRGGEICASMDFDSTATVASDDAPVRDRRKCHIGILV
jgi:hypothetical protein